jgi:hypothetical protein
VETWSQSGLRHLVIDDASAADINSLAKLFENRRVIDLTSGKMLAAFEVITEGWSLLLSSAIRAR